MIDHCSKVIQTEDEISDITPVKTLRSKLEIIKNQAAEKEIIIDQLKRERLTVDSEHHSQTQELIKKIYNLEESLQKTKNKNPETQPTEWTDSHEIDYDRKFFSMSQDLITSQDEIRKLNKSLDEKTKALEKVKF